MLGLIDHGTAGTHHLKSENSESTDTAYKVYFGLGHSLNLTHSPEVFKVSLAGVRLGNYLMQIQNNNSPKGGFLDVGTGSGAHALLMRMAGACDITAIDVSEKSIEQAKLHEHINFKTNSISFFVSDLFNNLPQRQFQTIVFNPPGWRTPSHSLLKRLNMLDQAGQIPLRSMFYGEEVVSRFLDDLPKYLAPGGTAIVGLNSLIGIYGLLDKYNKKHNENPPLAYRLMERHTFPLFYYSPHWKSISKHLKKEFDRWAKRDSAAYSIDNSGTIFWSYEIVEFRHKTKQ
ncbi:hypothetical protein BK649_18255 [Pseudomonas canadensis]|uniref:Methyltransferase small domain-containing protein n=1 Tax=Pseudomonas canadensis TaxID=915099 RepID=A0A423F449_9PSED|nr:methyltransferase [Pseudomonas canadensis]ROM49347.1 hypothetical protein BK649_18255 [Pseudomonas canadensis]